MIPYPSIFRTRILTASFVFALILFVLGTSAEEWTSQSAVSSAEDTAAKLVSSTRMFLAGHSSTPGVTVALREYSRATEQGRLVVRYQAFVSGPVTSQTFSMFTWPINAKQPEKVIDGVTLGRDGIVMCAGRTPGECGSSDKPDDPVDFTFVPAPGEPMRIALVSEDRKETILFGVVPEPLLKGNGGCSVEAVRLLPRWELVLIRAKGFKPDESLQFSSQSYSEKHDATVKADADGNYFSALLPAVQGEMSGQTKVEIRGSQCSPSLSFEWGKP